MTIFPNREPHLAGANRMTSQDRQGNRELMADLGDDGGAGAGQLQQWDGFVSV